MLRHLALPFACLLALAACSDDSSEDDTTSSDETAGDGDGDPSGDGDGDPTTTGDGDGDPTTTGDGDGDPTTTGDGDGDPTTTGDGDGDPTTSGDGDGDPDMDTTLYDGEFLLALKTDLGNPLQFIATIDASTQFVDITLQPLSLGVNELTSPREPVGDPLVYLDVPHTDGAFVLDLGVVMVPGEANPITGNPITVDVAIDGGFESEDLFCGTVSGDVMEPIEYDLEGSTFAAIRVADTSPQGLPVEFPFACP